MKRLFAYAILLLSLTACSDAPQDTSAEDTAPAAVDNAQNTTSDVVQGYLAVKDALVASDAGAAQQGAVNMLQVVDATEMPTVQQQVKEMAASNDLAALRVRFDSLSMALYEAVKQVSGSEQVLYKQYCPMAFDNRGAYWLSRNEEIRNPYFGDEMLKCGRTEEEINF